MLDNDPFFLTVSASVTDQFHSVAAHTLLVYWQSKRGNRPLPAWTDLNLVDIYQIVATVVVRDVVDGGREFRSRFSGTGMTAAMGTDGTGKLLAETYGQKGGAAIATLYRSVMNGTGPVRVVGHVQTAQRMVASGYEAIYLPLAGVDGAVGHVIAAYDFAYVPAPDEVPVPACDGGA